MTPPTFDGMTAETYAALLTGNVEDWRDEEGRPIGEVRASAAAQVGVVTRYGVCPWPGSRHNHPLPMNLSALRQTTRDWSPILGALDFVRAVWLDRYPSWEPTFLDYWRFAATQAMLPSFVVFRTADPKGDGEVPAFAGSINKMIGGVMSVCSALALEEIGAGRALDELRITPELIATYAEERGSLIGAKEVCAGPAPMLDEVLAVLSFGAAAPNHEAIVRLLPNPDAFLDYAEASVDLTLLLFVLALEFGHTVAAVGALDKGRWTAAIATYQARPLLGRFTRGLDLPPDLGHVAASALSPLLRTDVRVLVDLPSRSEAGLLAGRWDLDQDPTVATELGELFADHLRRERNALALVAGLRVRIHSALGRPAPTREITSEDLSALFGGTPTDLFASVLGISILSRSDSTDLRDGSQAVSILADGAVRP